MSVHRERDLHVPKRLLGGQRIHLHPGRGSLRLGLAHLRADQAAGKDGLVERGRDGDVAHEIPRLKGSMAGLSLLHLGAAAGLGELGLEDRRALLLAGVERKPRSRFSGHPMAEVGLGHVASRLSHRHTTASSMA